MAMMENTRNATASYTIERKYLAKISAAELISRIIRSHIKNEKEKKAAAE